MSSENKSGTPQNPEAVSAPYSFSVLWFMSYAKLFISRGSMGDFLCSQFLSFSLLERTIMGIGTKSPTT